MKALNRKEVLVSAKANGTLDSFKPLTRDEAFTKKALSLGGGAGGDFIINLTVSETGEPTIDCPFSEIVDAYHSGRRVTLRTSDMPGEYMFYDFMTTSRTQSGSNYEITAMHFWNKIVMDGNLLILVARVYSSGSITVSQYTVQLNKVEGEQ